jgi:outer membrane receptor protein involved in Fe transport
MCAREGEGLKVMVTKLFRILAVLAIVAHGSAWAQGLPTAASAPVGSASVKGLVKDSSGGSIPGAVVKVVSESGATVEAITDGEGAFTVASLAAGASRIEASLDGFETAVRRVSLVAGQVVDVELTLAPAGITEGVVVTARRSEEVAQEVPIPLSVVSGRLMAESGAFNVNRLKELIPTVQFYSTNPRNSSINIRGLGAPFGLTNDGIEPGVGLYIDGVFYSRPASATLDFLDVERVEVLRGPQGTLFGKNTTAGAINVTTRKPSFTPQTELELNYGSFQFVQAKGSITGPLARRVAGRLSFSGTQRHGVVENVATGDDVNDLSNVGVRGQAALRAVGSRRHLAHPGPHPTASRGLHAGGGGRRPDAAQRQSAVLGHCRRSRLHPAELQRLRSEDRRRFTAALVSGSRRRVAQRRLEGRRRPPDVDHRVALLELESVERSRFHRPADHHGLRGALDAAAMVAGGALRR